MTKWASAGSWSVLRAAQFHEFGLAIIRFLDRLPVMTAPKELMLQPIESGEVADRLVELALSGPPMSGTRPDIGGPEVCTFADLARSYFKMTGWDRTVVEVPLPGKTARTFREGAQTAPDRRYSKITWEKFLSRIVRSWKDQDQK